MQVFDLSKSKRKMAATEEAEYRELSLKSIIGFGGWNV